MKQHPSGRWCGGIGALLLSRRMMPFATSPRARRRMWTARFALNSAWRLSKLRLLCLWRIPTWLTLAALRVIESKQISSVLHVCKDCFIVEAFSLFLTSFSVDGRDSSGSLDCLVFNLVGLPTSHASHLYFQLRGACNVLQRHTCPQWNKANSSGNFLYNVRVCGMRANTCLLALLDFDVWFKSLWLSITRTTTGFPSNLFWPHGPLVPGQAWWWHVRASERVAQLGQIWSGPWAEQFCWRVFF